MKCLILVFTVLFFSNLTIAQNNNSNRIQNGQFGPERNNDMFKLGQRIEMLTKRLALSPDQNVKIKTIERQNTEEQQRLREREFYRGNDISKNFGGKGSGLSSEQRALYYEYIKLRKESNDKITELLNNKQKSKFTTIMERDEKILEDRMNGIQTGSQQIYNSNTTKNNKVPVSKNEKQKTQKK